MAKNTKLRFADYTKDPKNQLPVFGEVDTAFTHSYDRKSHEAHEILDVVVGDLNGDGQLVTVITGGNGQRNAAFVVNNGVAEDVTLELGLGGPTEPTYGLAIADIDGDGLLEVIAAQQSGLYVFSRDSIDSPFTATALGVEVPAGSTPVSIAVGDSNRNGHPDLFVSTFIEPSKFTRSDFNTPEVRNLNMLLINNGDGTFADHIVAAGLTLSQNTFQAVFTDLTGDGYDDIALALNTDRVIAYRNNGDGTFAEHVLHDKYGFWMGIAAGDTNGNGYSDLFVTNVGKSVPAFMLKGDASDEQPISTDFVGSSDFRWVEGRE